MQDEINEGILKAQGGIEKYAKKGAGLGVEYTKEIYTTAKDVHPALGLVVLLFLLIVGIIVILLVWNATAGLVGFFQTPVGIVVLLMLFAAIGLYAYLRYLGIGFKGWLGGIIEVALLMLILVMFVGASNMLMHFFMWIMPVVIIAGLVYILYKGIMQIENPTVKAFAVAMAILFVIVVIVANTFIVPYTFGVQKIVEIDITHVDRPQEEVRVNIGMYDPVGTMTLTTSMNPFIIGLGEMSQNMWKFGEIHEYIVEWELRDLAHNNELVAQSMNNHVYVVGEQTESIYAAVYLHSPTQHYFDYEVTVKVYDEHYALIHEETYHYYGYH